MGVPEDALPLPLSRQTHQAPWEAQERGRWSRTRPRLPWTCMDVAGMRSQLWGQQELLPEPWGAVRQRQAVRKEGSSGPWRQQMEPAATLVPMPAGGIILVNQGRQRSS